VTLFYCVLSVGTWSFLGPRRHHGIYIAERGGQPSEGKRSRLRPHNPSRVSLPTSRVMGLCTETLRVAAVPGWWQIRWL